VLYRDIGLDSSRGNIHIANGNLRRLRLQMRDRAGGGGFEFFRQSDDLQIAAVAIEHSLDKEVSTYENMTADFLASHAQHAGDPYRLLNDRHVAALASLLILILAVQPFLVGHLLRKLADHL